MLATHDLIEGEIILYIPHKLILTETVVRKTKMAKIVYDKLPPSIGVKSIAFCIYIMTEMRKKPEDRKFRYLLDLLPKNFRSTPFLFTLTEADYLTGSALRRRILRDQANNKLEYEALCDFIPEFDDIFSYEEYQ